MKAISIYVPSQQQLPASVSSRVVCSLMPTEMEQVDIHAYQMRVMQSSLFGDGAPAPAPVSLLRTRRGLWLPSPGRYIVGGLARAFAKERPTRASATCHLSRFSIATLYLKWPRATTWFT